MQLTAAALSATLTLFFCVGLPAQPGKSSHCDPLVDVHTSGPDTYKERGDRCEGEYEQKVSGGTGLRVASLTDAFPDFKFVPGDKLHLGWTVEGSPALRLRAVSLRPRLYYRMDSARPAGTDSWIWPADVIEKQTMTSRELGVTGVVRRVFGKEERDVYIPVRVAKNAAAPADRGYILVVTPAQTLSQLFLSMAPLQANGIPGDYLVEDQDLKQQPYPGQKGIRVPLPPAPKPGYYAIVLAGRTDNSKPVSVEIATYLAR